MCAPMSRGADRWGAPRLECFTGRGGAGRRTSAFDDGGGVRASRSCFPVLRATRGESPSDTNQRGGREGKASFLALIRWRVPAPSAPRPRTGGNQTKTGSSSSLRWRPSAATDWSRVSSRCRRLRFTLLKDPHLADGVREGAFVTGGRCGLQRRARPRSVGGLATRGVGTVGERDQGGGVEGHGTRRRLLRRADARVRRRKWTCVRRRCQPVSDGCKEVASH